MKLDTTFDSTPGQIADRLKEILLWLLGTAILILVIGGFRILYSSTQLYHFIHGLAKSGFGELSADWFANTNNPWLFFEILVAFTAKHLGEPFFYLYQFLLTAVYLYSLVGIADHFFQIRTDRFKFFIFLTTILITHAAYWPDDFGYTLYSGVATQLIPLDGLVPNSFGSLFLLSILLFLRGKLPGAIAVLAAACYFHPSYLIVGASLVAGYLWALYRQGAPLKRLLLIGGSALLAVFPLVLYFHLLNADATPQQASQAAQILAIIRLPHHTLVADWWDPYALVRFLLMAGGLVVMRKTRLFPVLMTGFLFIALPTALLAIRPSAILGGLMLWRPAIVFVPLSTTLLIAALVNQSFARIDAESRLFRWLLLSGWTAVLILVMVQGFGYQIGKIERISLRQNDPVLVFVREDLSPGDLYLFPPDWKMASNFRIETGAPVFADWVQHPWSVLDTLEWYQRYQALEQIYARQNPDRCQQTVDLIDRYGITHLVTPLTLNFSCLDWETIYVDDQQLILSDPDR